MAGQQSPVLVCGAGPVGLTAGLYLARQDVPVRVFERYEDVFEDPRAATFHPPTLELYEATGVTQRLHELGIVAPRWQMRDRRRGVVVEYDLSLLADVTRFPYRLQCEQHKLSRVLLEKLSSYPNVTVEWGREVIDTRQDVDGVEVVFADCSSAKGSWLIGTDGGRSIVRKSQDIGFEGFTYEERFLVITTTHDFEPDGYTFSNYVSDPEEWAALFKVPGKGPPGIWRVVFPVPVQDSEESLLDYAAAEQRLVKFLPVHANYEVIHTNLYQVHQRVASAYRKGRVFLAGDAAHVNNPLGGMGMNFGIHDAINLAEKLGQVIRGDADQTVLDRYDRQRRHVAHAFLQAMTIQNKKLLEECDEEKRKSAQDELRALADDPQRMREVLMRTSMIEGFRAAAAIV